MRHWPMRAAGPVVVLTGPTTDGAVGVLNLDERVGRGSAALHHIFARQRWSLRQSDSQRHTVALNGRVGGNARADQG